MKPHGFLVEYLNEKVATEINGNLNIENCEVSRNFTQFTECITVGLLTTIMHCNRQQFNWVKEVNVTVSVQLGGTLCFVKSRHIRFLQQTENFKLRDIYLGTVGEKARFKGMF